MHPVEYRLPAEWEAQDALLLAWPAAGGDWSGVLDAVRETYHRMIDAVLEHQPVVLLVPADDGGSAPPARAGLEPVPMRYNDTWCRDFGPVTLCSAGRRLALDFHFNGWGGKHEARLDNRVNARLAALPRFGDFEFRQSLFELEGGAIETDGAGTLLINRHCFAMRHNHLARSEIDAEIKAWLNIDHLLEIALPPMPGDDTDGHIDTFARFVAPNRIAFQQQRDPAATARLVEQLELLRDRDGRPCDLVAMPAATDVDARLPASYVNYALINDGVLMPRFGSDSDDRAAGIAADLFPDRAIHAVDARVLAGQGGGPHCACMQIPAALP